MTHHVNAIEVHVVLLLLDVGDSDIQCERLVVGNVFGVAVQGFSISTTVVSTDSSCICANPLVLW
jgi:hypothetical protein